MIRVVARALATGAVVAAVLAPTAALAAPHGRIVDVNATNGTLRLVFSTAGLSNSTSVDPSSVKVSIDGTAVASHAQPVSSQSHVVARSAVLAIDTSGSMSGEGLRGAIAAARAFIAAVPTDVRVGLVTFSDTAHVAVAPTTDRASLSTAIGRLKANGETALYDAVGLALHTLGKTGSRTLVLLTDGADTRSKLSLGRLVPMIQASKATVDAVGFRTTDTQSAPLRQIAQAGGGEVIAATATDDLAKAFTQAAADISHELVITADIPAQFANSSHTITVDASAAGSDFSDSVYAPLGAAKAQVSKPVSYGPQAAPVSKPLSKTIFYIGLAAFFVALAFLLAVALSALRRRESGGGVRRRLSIYTLTGRPVEESREEVTTVLGDSAVARSAVELAGRVVASRDLESVLSRKLEAAGVPMKAAEWLILHIGIAVLGAVLLLLLSGGGALATVIGLVAGLALPWFYLAIKESRRTNAFLDRMPDTLQLMAGGLLAGYSLPQSVDAVVREGSEPIASEFNRALVEARLGVAIEDALDGVAQRMRSVDFGWVVMAIRIQREVGGNLAEVLTTVAATLRERARLRRQVRVLSAEGRLSAWILGLLPVVFFLYLLLVRHSYISLLWSDGIGVVLIVIACVAMTVGAFWLRKVVRVEV